MAQILIWNTDRNGKDIKTSHAIGDMFSIKPDDFIFGSCEVEPMFKVIKIEANTDSLQLFVGSLNNADGSIYRISLWRWDVKENSFIRKSDGLRKYPKDLQ